MRRFTTALGAGALLVALAACAQPQSEVGYGGNPEPLPAPATDLPVTKSPDNTVEPKPEDKRTPVPKKAVDASALPDGYPRKVWTQSGGDVVVVIGQEGGCSDVHAEVAEQTPKAVTIVLVEEVPKPSGPCTMDIRLPALAVKLDAPLDDRTVVLKERQVTVPGTVTPLPGTVKPGVPDNGQPNTGRSNGEAGNGEPTKNEQRRTG